MNQRKTPLIFGAALVAIFIVVLGGLYGLRNFGKTDRVIDTESATNTINRLYGKVAPTTSDVGKVAVEADDMLDEAAELPEIDNYNITVNGGADSVEIWSSGEKAGSGTDGWMRELAESYNASHDRKITLRSVPSGIAVDYMASGKAMPVGYTPSNALWVEILGARGVSVDTITDRTVGNLAGIALSKASAKDLVDKYGANDLAAIVDAVIAGDVVIGYTNPNTSAAGLNLLSAILDRFGNGKPTSDTAMEKFAEFQANVPFVAMTTQQMRDAAQRGSLDGFVTELQVYNLDSSLSKSYEFVPIGWRHDNPLVAVGNVSSKDKETLEDFAKYCADNGADLAKNYGFNDRDSYKMDADVPSGNLLLQELDAYKDAKNAGVPVVAMFVCDTSGSMDGTPMASLKESLINSMRYIGKDNYVGIIGFADTVSILLPIDKFNMNQQALFKGAVVNGLVANGSTATVDGIIVGAKLLNDKVAELGNVKPMLFVLSDGYQNRGHNLSEVRDALDSIGIPIYTIAYGDDCDMASLQSISDINEAAVITSNTDDITYQLKNLFNANM